MHLRPVHCIDALHAISFTRMLHMPSLFSAAAQQHRTPPPHEELKNSSGLRHRLSNRWHGAVGTGQLTLVPTSYLIQCTIQARIGYNAPNSPNAC